MGRAVYVLKCRGGRYYVGTSEEVGHRISSHFDGGASEWTRQYPPVDVVLIERDLEDAEEREKELVQELIEEHGEEKVGGGPWSQTGGSPC